MRMVPKVKFKKFFPGIPSHNYMFMLEAMTYKADVEIPPDFCIDPHQIIVQAWTNQYDQYHCDGQWHAIDLMYCGSEDAGGVIHSYGHSVIITSNWNFNFTFRMKLPRVKEWIWSHGYQQDGYVHVEPPRHDDHWTLGPDYTHIFGGVHLGNFIAATNARECGFTHVLNVANNLDMVYSEDEEIAYKKIPMCDGAHNPIPEEHILAALDWLKMHDTSESKILVNCRAGIGRAGSVGVAYVFAQNEGMDFKDAYNHVSAKRFVYPHKGLKDTLYRHFPRKQSSSEKL